jgi:hypothetical protein
MIPFTSLKVVVGKDTIPTNLGGNGYAHEIKLCVGCVI